MTTAAITGATGTGRSGALPHIAGGDTSSRAAHIAARAEYIERLQGYLEEARRCGDQRAYRRLREQLTEAIDAVMALAGVEVSS